MGSARRSPVRRAAWIVAWLLAVISAVLTYAIDWTGRYRAPALGVCCCVLFVFGWVVDRRAARSWK